MLHEACDIVDDAGGWTCRTCHAHWRTSIRPENCADTRIPDGSSHDDAAMVVLAILVGGALLCFAGSMVWMLAP